MAGPFCPPARLLGPGPELSVVPSRWASGSLVAGVTASAAAWCLEAVRTALSLPSDVMEYSPVHTHSDLKAISGPSLFGIGILKHL